MKNGISFVQTHSDSFKKAF